jgi:hypothetical protein
MCTADISTHEVFSTCTERNVGLGNFHSLAIGLGFDMLSETPAIIARSDISPLMLRSSFQTAGVSFDTLASITMQV